MNTKWISALLLAFSVITGPALAQGDDQLATQALKDALVAKPRLFTATIVGIEPGTRTLTIRGTKGRVVPVVVQKEVSNFDALKIGDRVDVMIKMRFCSRPSRCPPKMTGYASGSIPTFMPRHPMVQVTARYTR